MSSRQATVGKKDKKTAAVNKRKKKSGYEKIKQKDKKLLEAAATSVNQRSLLECFPSSKSVNGRLRRLKLCFCSLNRVMN